MPRERSDKERLDWLELQLRAGCFAGEDVGGKFGLWFSDRSFHEDTMRAAIDAAMSAEEER